MFCIFNSLCFHLIEVVCLRLGYVGECQEAFWSK
jgi:hypothetical protein